MDFLEIAKKRHSVRSFHNQKIEEDKLLKILEAGRVAPTAANMQPQRLIVVQEESGMAKIKKGANIYGAPLAIIVCGDRGRVWKRTFDNKTTLDIDASIVTDHMMLQATELGLGSVWICAFKPDTIKKEFNLPKNLEPINILAVGYANTPPASPNRHDQTRLPLSEIVTYA